MTRSTSFIPREHGAWGILGQSFLAGLILAKGVTWLTLPAAAAVLLLFLLREPLIFLGRQEFVWKNPNEDTPAARRLVWIYVLLLIPSGCLLLAGLPWRIVASLGVPAFLLLAASTWLTVKNRQRSVWFQVVSSAGLNASALLAWVSVRPAIELPILTLWAILSAHATAAVLVVHAHLDLRIAVKKGEAGSIAKSAWIAQGCLLAGAALCVLLGQTAIAAPLVLSAAVHLWNLWRMKNPETLSTPLKVIGWRALALAISVAVVAIVALNPHPRPSSIDSQPLRNWR